MNNQQCRLKEGRSCPRTSTYGLFRDQDNGYAGLEHDRYIREGDIFPPHKHGYHFKAQVLNTWSETDII